MQRWGLFMKIELSFKRRKYLGKRKTAVARYRLIGVRDPIFREYFFYLTNIPQDKLVRISAVTFFINFVNLAVNLS